MPGLDEFPDIPTLRKFLADNKEKMSNTLGGKRDDVHEKDVKIPTRDGTQIDARIYTPASPPREGSPLAVVYHGGGFVLGGIVSEELLCRDLASKLGVVSVNVDYRLAPEHQFPIPVNDACDAAKWVRPLPPASCVELDQAEL